MVKEKNREAYLELARRREFDPGKTWMIGNSPKSDINPALEAGLGAVYVPHERTWTLERQELRQPSERLILLEKFSDLVEWFV